MDEIDISNQLITAVPQLKLGSLIKMASVRTDLTLAIFTRQKEQSATGQIALTSVKVALTLVKFALR